ncbi:hypothetical protein J3458_021039 [Metarhizium acridum]|uniref:uncharacterized protein n=1 Tax=Metarhizium acridum TaxID=92637 RepID=UPI001C6B1389|nr:hypothetical protein J3458_021039 [Metarhizium acridum]
MSTKLSQIDFLNWNITEHDGGNRVAEAIRRTNWDKLCQRASRLNGGLSCNLLDQSTNGLYNLVRLLQFSDQSLWIARISLRKSTAGSAILRSEADVMQFIKDKSSLPVPRVFAYEVDENNDIGVPYILMEFIPGNTAMDAAGGYEKHRGQIPLAYRLNFYRSVAKCHLQMTALRFSKIGTIFRTQNGEYDIGPFPDIGGPFNTATQFFKAWAENAKFPREQDEILRLMGRGPAQQVLQAINEFPSQIKEMASQLSQHNNGPFPLYHGDFLHSNMIVNESFEVMALIDWEGACTLPQELIGFPGFLDTMPVQFGSSESYDADGMPIDKEERQRRTYQQAYVQMVREIECNDDILSTCLSNKKGLALAYSIMAYRNGKLGFYNKVLHEHVRADSGGVLGDSSIT